MPLAQQLARLGRTGPTFLITVGIMLIPENLLSNWYFYFGALQIATGWGQPETLTKYHTVGPPKKLQTALPVEQEENYVFSGNMGSSGFLKLQGVIKNKNNIILL